MRIRFMVIDGQGGKMGKLLIEQLKEMGFSIPILAVGTNSIATSAMLKAGADFGATGENAVVYNSKTAEIIAGPLGILVANALFGEVTPAMAQAVGESSARRILIPISKCNTHVVGTDSVTVSQAVRLAAQEIVSFFALQEAPDSSQRI
ncbi:MAG: DUF3842 family protein [Oscillospiraceae bacterium]